MLRLTRTPVLTVPNNNDLYVVYTNASGIDLRCVLTQNDRVMVYASLQLMPHKRNYSTYDLDLATVIFALKIWSCYLYRVIV